MLELSIEFSVDIVNYYKWLCIEKKEFVMSKQILKSGTSIGANIHEANFSISRKEFIAKMHIAMKEAAETCYWLIVLEKTHFLPDEFKLLKEKCESLSRILIATLKTTKQNAMKNENPIKN